MAAGNDASLSLPVRTVGVEIVRGQLERAPEEPRERLVVGSAESADVVIADSSVSRFHVELSAAGEGVRVKDLGSTNGVVSGTHFLDDCIVPAGTLIELGAVTVRVVRGAPTVARAAGAAEVAGLVCTSAAMRRLVARLGSLAQGKLPVLIEGPPGSGKERVARALHSLGQTAAEPFIVIDCGALSEALGASEIFGHERGAYTDAQDARAGALERAGRGTIVFDEMDALAPALQASLLGVLERRRFRRMGGTADRALEARVVATSTAELRREVNAGRFRLDLYYRVAGARVEVPAISERLEDLPPLVTELLREIGHGESHPLASEESLVAISRRSWPGNVRELRTWVHEQATMGLVGLDPTPESSASTMTLEELLSSLLTLSYKEARARFEGTFERDYLEHLKSRARQGGRTTVSAAARLAGLDRSQLRQLARRAGVDLR